MHFFITGLSSHFPFWAYSFFQNSILSLRILKTQNTNPTFAKLEINLNETCHFSSLKQYLGYFI